jgi:protein-arginine kinase activator protein McsA
MKVQVLQTVSKKRKQPIYMTNNYNNEVAIPLQDVVEEIEEVVILESDYVCARCASGLAIYAPDTKNLEQSGTTNIHAAKCGHVFCHDCLKPLIDQEKCPVCNTSLNAHSLRQLFLA